MNLETHRLRERTYGCRGEGCREGIVREFWRDMYTPMYLKWVTNKDLQYSTGNSAQCYVAAWMRGGFGGEWIRVYVWLNPFTVHLKLSQHCLLIDCISIQNKKWKKKRVLFWRIPKHGKVLMEGGTSLVHFCFTFRMFLSRVHCVLIEGEVQSRRFKMWKRYDFHVCLSTHWYFKKH